MTSIDGPFLRAERRGIPILELFSRDLESAEDLLSQLVSETREEIGGAPGSILYRVGGTEPSKATPMQYGGLFLEKDRELLEFALEMRADAQSGAKGEVWLVVNGGEGTYLDFVSDLPADVFCWDALRTGFPLAEVRRLRTGRLCTNEPGSDEDFAMIESKLEGVRVAH